ncbi:MAG: phosphotransferase [Anaerolineales bacterium]|nr:phosphotransferase [Anaerolineales bacterium]
MMMENPTLSYLSSQTVAEAVLAHLWQQRTSHDPPLLHLTGSPLLLEKLWSTLYFLNVIDAGERRELVAKIARFPDQTSPEVSWQSEELLIRGRREFNTLTRVFHHFAQQPDPSLTALQPRAYLPEINAVVMDFVSGRAFYDECFTTRGILTGQGRRRALQIMERVGRWLRWFHHLPLEHVPPERVFGPAHTFEALLAAVENLRALGVNPEGWPRWVETLATLRQINHHEQVWTHGDFHLRNVLVVQPQDGVLGLDTALERVDSPYLDLGKFIADLKTRRGMLLSGGLLPPPPVSRALIRAFLIGYLAGQELALLPLTLYEGRFIFEKWVQSLNVIGETFRGRAAPMETALRTLLINPAFRRIVNHWLDAVRVAGEARPDPYGMQAATYGNYETKAYYLAD